MATRPPFDLHLIGNKMVGPVAAKLLAAFLADRQEFHRLARRRKLQRTGLGQPATRRRMPTYRRRSTRVTLPLQAAQRSVAQLGNKNAETKPFKLVAVALANKLARIVFAVMKTSSTHRSAQAWQTSQQLGGSAPQSRVTMR